MTEITAYPDCETCHGMGIEYLDGVEVPCNQCIRSAYLVGEISPEEYRDACIVVTPCDYKC